MRTPFFLMKQNHLTCIPTNGLSKDKNPQRRNKEVPATFFRPNPNSGRDRRSNKVWPKSQPWGLVPLPSPPYLHSNLLVLPRIEIPSPSSDHGIKAGRAIFRGKDLKAEVPTALPCSAVKNTDLKVHMGLKRKHSAAGIVVSLVTKLFCVLLWKVYFSFLR